MSWRLAFELWDSRLAPALPGPPFGSRAEFPNGAARARCRRPQKTKSQIQRKQRVCVDGTWLQILGHRLPPCLLRLTLCCLCLASMVHRPACCWPWLGPLRTVGQDSTSYTLRTSPTCPMAWPSQRERVELRGLSVGSRVWNQLATRARARLEVKAVRSTELYTSWDEAVRLHEEASHFVASPHPTHFRLPGNPTLRLPRSAVPRGARRTCLRSVRSCSCSLHPNFMFPVGSKAASSHV